MASKIKLIKEVFRYKDFIKRMPDLVRMVKRISKGEYKPKIRSFILPALAILYVLSPIDIIPDWIPVIGAMDDIAVLSLAIPALIRELEKFLIWEKERNSGIKTIEVNSD
ncbi:DUF1232 domain-containing protein [Elizabethkingia argentiflava]|uniref:DUF1232 domain-containing protein n=1 Tax=Elizabethkingia argenteiflava TaxID=2681556 RepID=A0A845PWC8_9FLAO|nr:DUF1232 domain-containing protein [Elizabethkingia argenteiflava]NAW50410.1 DUF1232 domain-containing protein [Elizabethkingia argenteiflava]